METELNRIAELVKSNPKMRLQTLVHIINEKNLANSHKKMSGNKASGVDEVTKDEYHQNLETKLNNLVNRMKTQAYKPQPSRRTYIAKSGSDKLRPLGIPSYEDKLVQDVMSQILNTIYEPEFLDFSYGFRPNRSCHDALKELNKILTKGRINYVVDVDIKGFFDNVDHKWMMKFLEHRIQDPNFLRLIHRFLKAGRIEDGKKYPTEKGTPQGGLISPILANIYLHYVLDLWFEKEIKKQSRGRVYIVRYADDLVCCFQYKEDAEDFNRALVSRLAGFGLEIAEDKTKTIEFGRFAEENREKRGEGKPEKFDFLGFTHSCGKDRKGNYTVVHKTSKKKMKEKINNAKKWLKENMHLPVKNLIDKLNVKLKGHYNYYGVYGNYSHISKFGDIVKLRLRQTLNRRSQRNRYNWEKFNKIIEKFPLVKPRITVSLSA